MAQTFPFQAFKPQCHQILELQNRDRKHSFTDAVVYCKDGFFRIHNGILRQGSSLSARNNINATSWTVVEISTVVFLFYLEQSRATFYENNGAQYFQDQLEGRLEALCVNPMKVLRSVPLLPDEVRGLMRNSLLIKMSDSLDGLVLRFTRTDGHGNDDGEFFISSDGKITPVPALEPMSPSASAPIDIDSSEDGSRIEGAQENLDVSSPTSCCCGHCGLRINRERISSPYDSFRVVSPPTQPSAPAPADSSRGVSTIGQPPENLDVPSPTISGRIEYETNPPPSDSGSYGNNSNGVEDDFSRNKRMRRPSEEEIENIPSNLNKRPRRRENRHEEASSSNRGRTLASQINNILSHSHPSHQCPGHVCKILSCGRCRTFFTVTDLLRHTHKYHGLFKLRHYRLRKVPRCLICGSRRKLLYATPEDFLAHVNECVQSKREELGAEWEPPLQGQIRPYTTVVDTTEWYEQLEDRPTSFTEEEYYLIMQHDSLSDEEDESDDESPSDTEDEDIIMQEDSSSDEDDESDDSLLSSADPEPSVGNVLESSNDTEDEDDLCLQIVTEDIAQRVLNSNF